MHTGFLDVLHDAADHDILAVSKCIDVDLGGVVEEAVEQYRRVIRDLHGLAHVALEIVVIVDDFHCPAAQHVARPHDQRITDLGGDVQRLLLGGRSEEHTSELQSLMRISYAVFCLKKTNNAYNKIHKQYT